MIPLSRIDAAFKRVQEDSPDLDITVLSLDDGDVSQSGREELQIKIAHIRNALVARIADTVKQASKDPSALDSAVAMAEVLISTHRGQGERPGRGRNHAVQAIQLLASTKVRFDEAIDLFFDVVERFCANVWSQGTTPSGVGAIADVSAIRTMQNYDQTLVKLISKHWNRYKANGNWDVAYPLERIKALRHVYEANDVSRPHLSSRFGLSNRTSTLFCESQQLLQSIQKGRNSDALVMKSSRDRWPLFLVRLVPKASDAQMLRRKRVVLDMKESYRDLPEIEESHRKVARRDSHFDDLREQYREPHTDGRRAGSTEEPVSPIDPLGSQPSEVPVLQSSATDDDSASRSTPYHAL